MTDIEQIERADLEAGGRRSAQGLLARELTELVHGREGVTAAERITRALFTDGLDELSEGDLEQLKQDGMPASNLSATDLYDKPLTGLLVECGLAKAGREVKDALGRSAVWVNGVAKDEADNLVASHSFAPAQALFGRFFVVKLGKKKYHLLELV